jgi:peptide/nickel transport system substrate-binding protein
MIRPLSLLLALLLLAPTGAKAWIEPPALQNEVAAGKLPPIDERLPQVPLVAPLREQGLEPGEHGGDLRILMSGAKDVRMMVVYGYARLVGYDREYRIVPDILEGLEVEEGRVFTFRLRPGHRWSDGEPFTAEDFRYFWEDVANNPDLSPSGIPVELTVEGEASRSAIPGPSPTRASCPRLRAPRRSTSIAPPIT